MPNKVNLNKFLDRRGISKVEILDLVSRLNKELFQELIVIIVSEKSPLNQKAAWVFNHAAKKYPDYYKQNYSFLVQNLTKLTPDGCKRDVLRGMLSLPLQEDHLGLLVDITMNWLGSFDVDVAVKYNSMRTLERIVKKYPDLKNEFHAVINQQLNLNTDTFKRQALKIILPI